MFAYTHDFRCHVKITTKPFVMALHVARRTILRPGTAARPRDLVVVNGQVMVALAHFSGSGADSVSGVMRGGG